MKVKVEASIPTGFQPFQVTFFIKTPEEAKRFHDDIACKATNGASHEFIAQAFRRIKEKIDNDYEGHI